MKTTVTLDDDVEQLLFAESQRTHRTFQETLNEAIRSGLKGRMKATKRRRFTVKAKPMQLKPGIDSEHLNALADELEITKFVNHERQAH